MDLIPPAPVFIFSTILFVEPHENHGVFYSRGGAAGGNRGVLVSLMVPLSTAYTAWPELLPASVYPVRPGFSIIASRPSYWGYQWPISNPVWEVQSQSVRIYAPRCQSKTPLLLLYTPKQTKQNQYRPETHKEYSQQDKPTHR